MAGREHSCWTFGPGLASRLSNFQFMIYFSRRRPELRAITLSLLTIRKREARTTNGDDVYCDMPPPLPSNEIVPADEHPGVAGGELLSTVVGGPTPHQGWRLRDRCCWDAGQFPRGSLRAVQQEMQKEMGDTERAPFHHLAPPHTLPLPRALTQNRPQPRIVVAKLLLINAASRTGRDTGLRSGNITRSRSMPTKPAVPVRVPRSMALGPSTPTTLQSDTLSRRTYWTMQIDYDGGSPRYVADMGLVDGNLAVRSFRVKSLLNVRAMSYGSST
ncbi:hypothetical protein BGW80DRAFT_1446766 [Lactifluus volemus]|nr:hypothetical protein BGW80DRAFT_1446766 [Lactifluus volemus]